MDDTPRPRICLANLRKKCRATPPVGGLCEAAECKRELLPGGLAEATYRGASRRFWKIGRPLSAWI
jgi:hypothetical protein